MAFSNEREEFLSNLQEYMKNADKELTLIFQSLHWDRKHIEESQELNTCPVNKGHRVPLEKLCDHVEKCELRSQGYLEDEEFLPDSSLDKNSPRVVDLGLSSKRKSIILDAKVKNPALKTTYTAFILEYFRCFALDPNHEMPIPQTTDRILSSYTLDERRIFYDYAVANTPNFEIEGAFANNVNIGEECNSEEPKSKLGTLADLRNMKRRRIKYKVSTKSKNYLEVLREVINNQMAYLYENPATTSYSDKGKKHSDYAPLKNKEDQNNKYKGQRSKSIRDETLNNLDKPKSTEKNISTYYDERSRYRESRRHSFSSEVYERDDIKQNKYYDHRRGKYVRKEKDNHDNSNNCLSSIKKEPFDSDFEYQSGKSIESRDKKRDRNRDNLESTYEKSKRHKYDTKKEYYKNKKDN